jgi:putative zinc finger/helix-turn-helix YgiT family protein
MELVTISYTVQFDHDGRKYQVTVPDLSVPRCAKCSAISLDEKADRQIDAAFRKQAGLLAPEEIRRQRTALKLTQEELAEAIGIASTTLSRWETGGQIQQRSLDKLLRLFFELPEVRRVLHG